MKLSKFLNLIMINLFKEDGMFKLVIYELVSLASDSAYFNAKDAIKNIPTGMIYNYIVHLYNLNL